ncbi:MAG: hypothetical protein ABIJ56_02785 [Pseudomonadota bacterium]
MMKPGAALVYSALPVLFTAFIIAPGCNKSSKGSPESHVGKPQKSDGAAGGAAVEPAPANDGKPAGKGAVIATGGAGKDEPEGIDEGSVETAETAPAEKKSPPMLPDMSGLGGMDPDQFPEGIEGLDQIVAAWTQYGEDARAKVDKQTEAHDGKEPAETKLLKKCLPSKIKGWKKEGDASETQQQHRGAMLPMASITFGRGEATATLTIVDTLMSAEIRVGFEMGVSLVTNMKTSRQKYVEEQGEPGYIIIHSSQPGTDKKTTSKGALLVAERFLVVVTIEEMADFDEARIFLSLVNIDSLKKLDR